MSIIQIAISQTTDAPPALRPGELAFSYKSKKLFIGPSGSYKDPPGSNIIELMSLDRYLLQEVVAGVRDHAPSSDAIFWALKAVEDKIYVTVKNSETSDPAVQANIKTIEFDTSDNNFILQRDQIDPKKITISTKPIWGNLNIDNDISKQILSQNTDLNFKSGIGITLENKNNQLEVNANIDDINLPTSNTLWSSLKIKNAISDSITLLLNSNNNFLGNNTVNDVDMSAELPTSKKIVNSGSVRRYLETNASQIISGLSLIKFVFNQPGTTWLINHNKNTSLFQKSIHDESGNEMLAFTDVIDDNNFSIHLTEPMRGFVLVRF
jgi:hypothetical protein